MPPKPSRDASLHGRKRSVQRAPQFGHGPEGAVPLPLGRNRQWVDQLFRRRNAERDLERTAAYSAIAAWKWTDCFPHLLPRSSNLLAPVGVVASTLTNGRSWEAPKTT